MYQHADVTERIIAAFFKVYNTLGYGFLEKVYQNAMAVELASQGLAAEPQAPLTVHYAGVAVGEYFADFLVEGRVVVELKAVEQLAAEHHAQLLNYLKATDITIGLLLNFGPKPEVKRKVYETARLRPALTNGQQK
ncbi:MAG: GxxExxY protein [Gemmataceae bacterium]